MLLSSSLVPLEVDPSVLFTTAGMHQFKHYYIAPQEAPASRIATSQKCLRTGDISEVGDNTHLTFFEMLGNFSFGYPAREGSYFKKEVIPWAWEFLTQVLGIDENRIHATYFKGEKGVASDEESLEILQSIDGLGKIVPQGFHDNFWSLGSENSPGGPTVEFYVDDIEVWNLVFNEYVLRQGKYEPTDFKGVDTGMGLERLTAVMEGVENVYQTDLFELPHKKLHEILRSDDLISERIILDHIKAATFAINDGIIPSNKDRGYIVRRLIRRAIVKGQQLGITASFTTNLAEAVFKTYEGIYFDSHFEERSDEKSHNTQEKGDSSAMPQDDKKQWVLSELEKEEKKFRQTLSAGLRLLNSFKEISGKELFDLYQSYGLPLEISLEEAKRANIKVGDDAVLQFETGLKKHQELSRTASVGMFKGGLADMGESTTKFHTTTHLLLAALRQVLDGEIQQRGANITPERIRFDFSYPEKLTPEQIEAIEDLVNDKIKEDLPVEMEEMTVDEAKKSGAMGVFDSKYGERVKVYTIGKSKEDYFSKEICGGPHATHTGELGHFKIVKEESSSAGVRRIKAVLE